MFLVPERALLNDVSPHIVHFYGWLKREFITDVPMRNSEKLYYAHRRRFNELLANGVAASPLCANHPQDLVGGLTLHQFFSRRN